MPSAQGRRRNQLRRLWQLALIVVPALLALNLALGLALPPQPDAPVVVQRDFGAAIAVPVVLGFCLLLMPLFYLKAEAALVTVARATHSPYTKFRPWPRKLLAGFRRLLPAACLLGALFCISFFVVEDLLYAPELSLADNIKRWPLLLQAALMWVLIVLSLLSIMHILRTLCRCVRQGLSLSLFHTQDLDALVRCVLWFLLVLAAGVALAPLFWLQHQPSAFEILLVGSVGCLLVGLLLYPIFSIRHILAHKKQQAIARLNQAIKAEMLTPQQHHRRLTDSQERMQLLDSMAVIREEYAKAKEWPMDMHVSLRLVSILAFPPSTWAAASVVDTWIKPWLN